MTTTTSRPHVPFTADTRHRDQVTVVWEGLTMLDATGKQFELPAWEYKCVQMIDGHEFHSSQVEIEGSIDGQNWAFLHDRWTHERLRLSLYCRMADIAESPKYIRPRVEQGTENSTATVKLFCRRSA